MKVPCVFVLVFCVVLSSVSAQLRSMKNKIDKPYGSFSSMITPKSAAHPLCNGLLIRTSWAKLEPKKDRFDFSDIERQIETAEKNSKNKRALVFSLAISSGLGGREQKPYPLWLIDEGVKTMTIKFRSTTGEVPKMWDPLYQKRLKKLADALSKKYSKDKRIKLIYVPQATANGIEGHFNGTSYSDLNKSGLTEKTWVKALKQAAISFADSFPTRAIAIEVHEVLGSHKIPMKALNELYKMPKYRDQIGAGMWWISGGVKYQPNLIKALKKYPGDIYGQVIGNSSQLYRFGDKSEDYRTVFKQAIELGIRYLEVWNFEFDYETQNGNLKKFNQYSYDKYEKGIKSPKVPEFEKPKVTASKMNRNNRRQRK
ncbi:MAG: hypothetical protein NE330_21310 [Lentisphaeraceae bacterium]|nr:hypothetical protein [Lentisphaeraceae bacterium]